MSRESAVQSVISFHKFGMLMCEGIGLCKGLDVIRNYPKSFKFDLVIHDFTCGPCLLGLLPQFKYPPVVGISAYSNPHYTVDIVGGDKLGLTAKPHPMIPYDAQMNIFERIHNGLLHFLDSL
jgi:glucuronosyltransferase